MALILLLTAFLAPLLQAATQTGPNFVVNSLADTDDGSADFPGQGTGNQDCTLREALTAATAYGDGAIITFGVSGTISVGSTLPEVNRNITIDGSGQSVVLDGNGTVQIMLIYSRFFNSGYIAPTINALTFKRSPNAIRGSFANLNVSNCTFDSNVTGSYGGGILSTNQDAPLNITNCTFSNNSALGGSAIYAANVVVTHCTFYGNQGTLVGGSAGTIIGGGTVRNSLFAFSRNGQHCSGGLNIDSSNIADDGTCGSATRATTAQINLGPLQNNGGSTPTMALLTGSAAINAGNPAFSTGAPVNNQDQRGASRVGSSDPYCDAGAYEFNNAGVPAAAPTFSPTPGYYGVGSLAITLSSATPGSSIYYTTDGTTPSATNGTLYSGPFTITAPSNTVRATATAPGFAFSTPLQGIYALASETPSLVVTLASDVINNIDGQTSLREAVAYANNLGGIRTITFAPALQGQTVMVVNGWSGSGDDTALRTSGDLTINGGTGVTINLAAPIKRRLFANGTGSRLALIGLTLSGGDLSGASDGGSVWSGGTLDVTNVYFTNNKAEQGGAIWSNGTVTVGGSTFYLNSASVLGGAIASFNALTVTDSTFSGNHSDFNGGAVRLDGTAVVSGSTFSNNSAVNGGGAVMSHGQTTITNSTIAYNTALDGGGAQFFSGTASLRHATITSNIASRSGGGVAVNSADVTMINTIASGNFGQDQNDLWGSPLNAASSSNLINVAAASLRLDGIANTGGLTFTISPLAGSPAIDAGIALDGITTDQRGTARPQADGPDIGAVEFTPTQVAADPVMTPVGIGGTPFDTSVQVTLSTSSPGAIIRYTTDGTYPTPTNGQIYTGPLTFSSSTDLIAIAYGSGWLPSANVFGYYTIYPSLNYWRQLQGLDSAGRDDLGNPSGDGVANLLKYAFNMAPNPGDLANVNTAVLPENGTAGLPFITHDAQGRLRIEFVRKKPATQPGIRYLVETSPDLTAWQALDLAGASIVSIDATWERVTVTDPVTTPTRFGRVRVEGPYYNNFNNSLGAGTLRGSAEWSNRAVMLTDAINGQGGAVVFDGLTTTNLGGFTATFYLAFGPTTSVPGDGASFAIGDLGTGSWGETGPGTAQSLAVGFDTYDNGGNGAIGIHVWVNGAHVAFNATDPYTDGNKVPVEISYAAATGLTVRFNNEQIFTNLAVPGFSFPANGRFGLGARTGGANQRTVVDNVEITTR